MFCSLWLRRAALPARYTSSYACEYAKLLTSSRRVVLFKGENTGLGPAASSGRMRLESDGMKLAEEVYASMRGVFTETLEAQ